MLCILCDLFIVIHRLVSRQREVAVLTGEKEELEERVTLQENKL